MKIGGKSLKWWFYAARGIYLPESDEERWAMHVVKQDIEKILKETEGDISGEVKQDDPEQLGNKE